MCGFDRVTAINGAKLTTPLLLSAASGTDIANRINNKTKLPSHLFSAPFFYHRLPTASFRHVRASFRCQSGYEINWDQAGIVLLWPKPALPNPDADHPGDDQTAPDYVMAGIETCKGKVMYSCVENRGEVDWSTWPVEEEHRTSSLVVEVVKMKECLAMFIIQQDTASGQENKILFRLIPWCFQFAAERETLWVGFFAARPDWAAESLEKAVEVEVEEFEITFENNTTLKVA